MQAPQWHPCVLIPVYNHEGAIKALVDELLVYRIPVLLINDGSGPACTALLQQLASASELVELIELPENRGKGAAVKHGLRAADERGFSHALQIDADGQHAVADMEKFLAAARQRPAAMVSGYPVYDDSVPALRYYGRYLTHVWVYINTLSLTIKDSMCGYRVYPVAAVCRLLDRVSIGDRMQFDTEMIVRWVWAGGEVINLPTRVSYPADGVSHFALWRDNFLISKMHACLFFGMLIRLPWLLWRKYQWRRAS